MIKRPSSLRPPRELVPLLLAVVLLISRNVHAQTQIETTIDPSKGLNVAKIAVPFPEVPNGPDNLTVNSNFFAPLTRDLVASDVFALTPLPPNVTVTTEVAKSVGAMYLLKLKLLQDSQGVVIEARMLDTSGQTALGKAYRGTIEALPRMAHTLANDLVRTLTGRPGIFLSQIAYASNRDGAWEIYLMDWDGNNQRRITTHNALSILPSWSPDNQRMVYTSFVRGTSDMYIISRRGGARVRVPTGLGLNTSATFSPVSNDIAFVGSQRGNPEIYVIRDNGTNLRRLTNSSAVESTPEWSPNGRQISFTSGRGGSPQIYTMDAEGTNVQRISFDGDWNDDATWSPDGERIAYTSRVNGRFQIRVHNTVTGRSNILAAEGSNEQPTWSPDGKWIAFQSNRSGKWQIYRMRADGTDIRQLTTSGENKNADWSKKAE